MIDRGLVKNGMVVLDAGVVLPEGIKVKVEPIAAPNRPTLAQQLGDLIGSVPDLSADMAQRYDHQIHGARAT